MSRADTSVPYDPPARAGRLVAVLATLAYTALIVLVSLVPARVDLSSAHLSVQFDAFLGSFVSPPHTLHDLRDLATNFVLYVPLGALLPWTFQSRPWRLEGLLGGALLSGCLEVAQAYTNRFPSVWDIAMNGAGHTAAYVLATAAIAHGHLSASLFVGGHSGTPRRRLAAGLRVLLLGMTLVLALLPYNITVSLSDLSAKLHGELPDGGRILINPLSPWNTERASSLVTTLLVFTAFGFLSAFANTRRRGRLNVALMGVLLSAGVECIQIVVRSRTSDILQVIVAGGAAALGMAVARAWDRTHAETGRTLGTSGRPGPRSDYWFAATLLYALLLWAVAWRPFVFVSSPREAIRRLLFETYWLPLRAYFNQERSLEVWRDLARESSMWVPLGVLLQVFLASTRWRRRGAGSGMAFAVGLIWGSFVELSQALIVNRVPDATDILNHILGLMAGYLVASALLRGQTPEA